MKLLFILLCVFYFAKADWFDDLAQIFRDKVVAGADYIKEETFPALREKFEQIKTELKDPENYEKARLWLQETVPVVKEKVNSAADFVYSKVYPELKALIANISRTDEASSKK